MWGIYFIIGFAICAVPALFASGPLARWATADRKTWNRVSVFIVALLVLLPVGFAALADIIDYTELITADPFPQRLKPQFDVLSGMVTGGGAQAFVGSIYERICDQYAASTSPMLLVMSDLFLGSMLSVTLLSGKCDRLLSARATKSERETTVLRGRLENCKKVMQCVMTIVGTKRTRISQALAKEEAVAGCDLCWSVLNPKKQIDNMVEAVYHVFEGRLAKYDSASVRVALFLRKGDYLQVVRSLDGRQWTVVTSPNERFSSQFRVTEPPDSIACCVFRGRPAHMIIEDCAAADGELDHPFRYFEASQKNRLGSLLACQLRGAYEDTTAFGCLILDSNEPSFFTGADDTLVKLLQEQIALRLDFEMQMQAFLARANKQEREASGG